MSQETCPRTESVLGEFANPTKDADGVEIVSAERARNEEPE